MGNHNLCGKTFRVLYVVFLCGIIEKTSANTDLTCNVVVSADFKGCMNPFRNKTLFKQMRRKLKNPDRLNGLYNTYRTSGNLSEECKPRKLTNKDICNRKFIATVVDLIPFSIYMTHGIKKMLKDCCDGCAQYNTSNTIKYMSRVKYAAIMSSDIVFPVISRSSVKSLYGYHFLPVLDAPTAYYITKKTTKIQTTQNIINACKNLWPLLTICLLLALISGFIAWIMENEVNEEEFPKPFHIGLFEGFWWSFVSMTTVGYGDKAPKSRPGRIFAIFWILIGVTICSMFTASLTTEISALATPENKQISGNNISVLKHRLLDAAIISTHGGIINEIEYGEVVLGIKMLIKMLHDGNITGFLIDSTTYYYFYSTINYDKNVDGQLKQSTMIRTEKSYGGEKLYFGILLKNLSHFKYFENYFANNRLVLESCNNFRMNANLPPLPSDEYLFDPASGGLFFQLLFCSIGSLVFIGIFGALYEIRRHRRLQKAKTRVAVDEENEKY